VASPFKLTAVDSEPRGGATPTASELLALRAEAADRPGDRVRRAALIRALLAQKDFDSALSEAAAWRARDAYNLVAVRTLGDVHMERGEKDEAERVYSAIVELLPHDADAQRALAMLLKQWGDLAGAKARLTAALSSRPDDARLRFELADVNLRLGDRASALAGLREVASDANASEQTRYPARQRLGQLYGEMRREARAAGDDAAAAELARATDDLGLRGGLENDVHIYLTWDTDRTDVDLWVFTPTGEKVFYGHRRGRGGESLFDDVTTGYGPESFTAKSAQRGEYRVAVNYFSGRRGAFPDARGEVTVVLDEGRPSERKEVFPYRLFAEGQTVTVATMRVGGDQ
jgi:tetratricopeptide (TPR) repeat protein